MYAFRNDIKEKKVCKGIKRCDIEKMKFGMYKDFLMNTKTTETVSKDLKLYTVELKKVALSPFDYKRFLVDKINTLPYGAQFQYYIYGKVVKEDDGKDLKNDNTVELVDDFPAFLFSEIETDKESNHDQHKNCSTFYHYKVKNVWFEVNGRRYPEELLDLNWDKEKYTIAYEMQTHYKKVFIKTHNELPLMYLIPNNFKEARPLFVIDLTRQPQNINESRNNILLHVDFDTTST
ncbi:hypothetical protein JTB14_038372 [Gonioctena quinquepunctata]|nr:hypothetical protein JTB14_038372 [Gonioctena quinquepunctata]